MSMKKQGFTKFLKEKHYGKWLVVSSDYSEILGFSEDLKKLTDEFKQRKVIYTRAENPNAAYAFESRPVE